MSLHARTSPAAAALIAAQKRNSVVSAIIIGLLIMALLAMLFYSIGITMFSSKVEPFVTYIESDEQKEEEIAKRVVINTIEKKPSAPSSISNQIITVNAPSSFSVASPNIHVDAATLDFGMNEGFGATFNSGLGSSFSAGFSAGGSGAFVGLPASMRKRCSPQERMQRLLEMGGTKECEDAVMKSLRWMKRTQNADGSWCHEHPVGMTGLALLAFLGHCETPISPEFGQDVEEAIIYLVNVVERNNGKLASDLHDKHWAYEHGIATYALAEAYTFCDIIGYKIDGLREAVTLAGDAIVRGQASVGMWCYAFNNSSRRDLSVTAWQLQAMKALKHSGIKVQGLDDSVERGLEAIKFNQTDQGWFGYCGKKPAGGKITLTGAGLLCLQQWGLHQTNEAQLASRWLDVNTPFTWGTGTAEIYGHYYNSQAFMELGGAEWARYNDRFREETLSGQSADGSYTIPRGNGAGARYNSNTEMGLHYRTCLATLMLEVYYRFLPGTSAK